MYVCILAGQGQVRVHKNLRSAPEAFLEAIAPYRADLVVAVEGIFTWYWRADLCARSEIGFVLGHALYMKVIHEGKVKNDRIDALKIATLLTELELSLVRQAKQHNPQAFQVLRPIPSVGKILALTILDELHGIRRVDRVQEFASYARLVKRFGKRKTLSVLAHKRGRAISFMRIRGKAFDRKRFLPTEDWEAYRCGAANTRRQLPCYAGAGDCKAK